MKKQLLIISILFLFGKEISLGQTYVPFPTSNAMWFEGDGYNDATYYWDYTYYYYINGDTIINSLTYHNICKSDTIGQLQLAFLPPMVLFYGPFPGGSYYQGALREDSTKHIYYFPANDTIEHLLYDFNLNVGDTLTNFYGTNGWVFTVTSIDSIFDGSIYHKQFHINPNVASIIEGIGSTEGLTYPLGLFFPGEQWGSLLCFSEDTVVKYTDSYYHLCTVTGIEEHSKEDNLITLYPNPTNNFFTINNISSNENILLEILNTLGEVVYTEKLSGKSEYNINPNIAQGIYFVKLSAGGYTQVKKVVKMD